MSFMNFMNNNAPAPSSNPFLATWEDPQVMDAWCVQHRIPAIMALARAMGPAELLPEILLALEAAPALLVEREIFAITARQVARN